MGSTARLFLTAALSFAASSAGAQDLSTFLSSLPPEGAWAKYRITTEGPKGTKVKPFLLSISGSEEVDGARCLRLEAGPTKFAGRDKGVLRLLLKASSSPGPLMNPFLEAIGVAYQEPEKAPFKLSPSALDYLHGQAKKVRIDQKRSDLPAGPATTVKGQVIECARQKVVTSTETRFLTTDYKTVEEGIYWFSDSTPFKVVRAEITRVETKDGKEKQKRITIALKEWSFSGAQTRFTKPPQKEKGVFGLLVH